MKDFTERSLIETILAPLSANQPGAFGLGDDAALISPRSGFELVVSKDSLVAGVHFFADDSPEQIAAKALRVNLSDLYAKGATPEGYFLGLFLPENMEAGWLRAFADGLRQDQEKYEIGLLGGDTVRTTGPLALSITMFGEVPAGKMVHRHGACPGDGVFVSGPIGDAALGLKLRMKELQVSDSEDSGYLLQKYLLPDPDPALIAPILKYASAAMDISDGLAGDLHLLCAASRLAARVNIPALPLSPAARKLLRSRPETLNTILSGGDDYKILCTVPKTYEGAFTAQCGGRMSRIGEMQAGDPSVKFIGPEAKKLSLNALSYRHF